MQLREPVALGEDLQNTLGVLNEVRVAPCGRVTGCIASKDEQRQRLVFLPHGGDDRLARALKTDSVNIDAGGKIRKGGKQAFDLVTMRADEADTGVLWVLKTGAIKKSVSLAMASIIYGEISSAQCRRPKRGSRKQFLL